MTRRRPSRARHAAYMTPERPPSSAEARRISLRTRRGLPLRDDFVDRAFLPFSGWWESARRPGESKPSTRSSTYCRVNCAMGVRGRSSICPPERDSLMAEILARHTHLPVAAGDGGGLALASRPTSTSPRPGFHGLLSSAAVFQLGEPVEKRGHRRPVDDFLSLPGGTCSRRRRSPVVLSGMGTKRHCGRPGDQGRWRRVLRAIARRAPNFPADAHESDPRRATRIRCWRPARSGRPSFNT